MGDTYRKAANKPIGRLGLLGMWLIFGPQLAVLLAQFIDALLTGGAPWFHFIYLLVFIVIYAAILAKVSMNYARRKREAERKT